MKQQLAEADCERILGACTCRWASIRTAKSSCETGTNFVELLNAFRIITTTDPEGICSTTGTEL